MVCYRFYYWEYIVLMSKFFSINVKNNIKEFSKGLNRFQKKQVPFVAATTLTDVAFKVRENAITK